MSRHLKVGDKVKVIDNYTSHNQTVGEYYKIKTLSKGGDPASYTKNTGFYVILESLDGTFVGDGVYFDEFELTSFTKVDMLLSIDIMKAELKKCESVLNYLNRNEIEEVDVDFYVIDNILDKLVDSSLPLRERYKELVNINKYDKDRG